MQDIDDLGRGEALEKMSFPPTMQSSFAVDTITLHREDVSAGMAGRPTLFYGN